MRADLVIRTYSAAAAFAFSLAFASVRSRRPGGDGGNAIDS